MYFVADLSLAVPVTNALTLVFTAVAGRLTGEDVSLSVYFNQSVTLIFTITAHHKSLCLLGNRLNN